MHYASYILAIIIVMKITKGALGVIMIYYINLVDRLLYYFLIDHSYK